MIPVVSVPHVQAPPPIMTEVLSGVPTEVSGMARIPFNAVPASVSAMQVYHNGRGTGRYEPLPRPDVAIPAAADHHQTGSSATGRLPVAAAPFTTSFMAQVMGQGGAAEAEGLVASFMRASQQRTAGDEEDPLMQRLRVSEGLTTGAKPDQGWSWLRVRVVPVWRGAASMVRPLGVEGYVATRTRNDANLKPKPTESNDTITQL